MAKIIKGQKVLDAGCGVGSTAIYIANKTSAHVTEINIGAKQIAEAIKNSIANNTQNNTTFLVRDFHRTKLPNNHFDVVYGIECICYSSPQNDIS